MFRELREAWRIVRIAKDDGYKGPFVVLRETMMEEIMMLKTREAFEKVKAELKAGENRVLNR